jgi:hypothetical protein
MDKHPQPVRTGTENPDLSSVACGKQRGHPGNRVASSFKGE